MSDEYRKLQQIHSALDEIKQILPSLRPERSWIWIIVTIWFFSGWPGSKFDRWTDRVWYSMVHNADWKNVDIQKRPSDCDFLHAPLGDKGCQFKKASYSFTDEGRRKLLQQAMTQEERTRLTNVPNTVTVYWEKKND